MDRAEALEPAKLQRSGREEGGLEEGKGGYQLLLFTIGTPDTVPGTTPTGSAGSSSDSIPAIRQFSPSLEVLRQDTD